MSAPLEPATLAELGEAVKSAPRVVARGGGTKPNLWADASAAIVSTARLSGVVEYDPMEFTFTARAGTSLAEIGALLAERGQRLPFDPPLGAAGATLGGTVAAGFNGPGRLRFGGVRDFILGVRFADGEGRILRMGGKVVKNAAGFDLPKFLCGSLGRYGILGEVTLKVFPRPEAAATLELPVADESSLAGLLSSLARGRWELEAVEVPLPAVRVLVRLAGPAAALEALAADVGRLGPVRTLDPGEAGELWRSADGFSWAHAEGTLCKVPLVLAKVPAFLALVREIPGARGWLGAAGGVGFVSLPASAEAGGLDARLREPGLSGLAWRGPGGPRLGARAEGQIHAAVKKALDPDGRFPSFP